MPKNLKKKKTAADLLLSDETTPEEGGFIDAANNNVLNDQQQIQQLLLRECLTNNNAAAAASNNNNIILNNQIAPSMLSSLIPAQPQQLLTINSLSRPTANIMPPTIIQQPQFAADAVLPQSTNSLSSLDNYIRAGMMQHTPTTTNQLLSALGQVQAQQHPYLPPGGTSMQQREALAMSNARQAYVSTLLGQRPPMVSSTAALPTTAQAIAAALLNGQEQQRQMSTSAAAASDNVTGTGVVAGTHTKKSFADAWSDMIDRLEGFKEKYGHCLVPTNYKEDPKLGTWVSKQRHYRSNGTLSNDRYTQLDDMGFIWKAVDKTWEKMFERLLEYKKEVGDCMVPTHYKKDPQLGRWVHMQRNKKDRLSEDHLGRLEEVGFKWSVHKALWANKKKEEEQVEEAKQNDEEEANVSDSETT